MTATETLPIKTQLGLVAKGKPDMTTAQVAFDNECTWGIVGKYWSESGYKPIFPMPPVACPVIDTHEVTAWSKFEALKAHYCSSPAGCSDVDGLIAEATKIGCTVRYPTNL